MRRFYFDRQTDVSGTSGTGAVTEGVEFSDGRVVLRWLTALSSISIYSNIEECIVIHGHQGSTNLYWVDDEPCDPASVVGDMCTYRPAHWARACGLPEDNPWHPGPDGRMGHGKHVFRTDGR